MDYATEITFGNQTLRFETVALANDWITSRYKALSSRGDARANRVLEAKIETRDLGFRCVRLQPGRKINVEWLVVASRRMPDTYAVEYLERLGDINRWGKHYMTLPV